MVHAVAREIMFVLNLNVLKQSYINSAILLTWLGFAMLKQADPVSGSIISNVLGAKNIMLFCEIFESELIQTRWYISIDNTTLSAINRDDRFNLTGNIIMSDGYTISLNTNMTIVELTAELDGAVICCGTENSILGCFQLSIYSKSVYCAIGRGVFTSIKIFYKTYLIKEGWQCQKVHNTLSFEMTVYGVIPTFYSAVLLIIASIL